MIFTNSGNRSHGDSRSASSALAPLIGQEYDDALAAFHAASDERKGIENWFTRIVGDPLRGLDSPRILSIGCGDGSIDAILLPNLVNSPADVTYDALDPRASALDDFTKVADQMGFALVPHAKRFEDFRTDETWDLVHAIHSMHYLEDPEVSLKKIITLSQRYVAIITQGDEGIVELRKKFPIGNTQGNYSAPQLISLLEQHNIPYTSEVVPGTVDVSECLNDGSDKGAQLLSFFLLASHGSINPQLRQQVTGELQNKAKFEDGRWTLDNPFVGILMDVSTQGNQ